MNNALHENGPQGVRGEVAVGGVFFGGGGEGGAPHTIEL